MTETIIFMTVTTEKIKHWVLKLIGIILRSISDKDIKNINIKNKHKNNGTVLINNTVPSFLL